MLTFSLSCTHTYARTLLPLNSLYSVGYSRFKGCQLGSVVVKTLAITPGVHISSRDTLVRQVAFFLSIYISAHNYKCAIFAQSVIVCHKLVRFPSKLGDRSLLTFITVLAVRDHYNLLCSNSNLQHFPE